MIDRFIPIVRDIEDEARKSVLLFTICNAVKRSMSSTQVEQVRRKTIIKKDDDRLTNPSVEFHSVLTSNHGKRYAKQQISCCRLFCCVILGIGCSR